MSAVTRKTEPPAPATTAWGRAVIYPESDGQPMGENTLQILWIMTIVGGLQAVFRDRDDVFVAGDLFWYPVEGDPKTRVAPDVMVVFGRPKGHRGSYRQWEEGGLAPQVVFEVLSPGNRLGEMMKKFEFYERLGVEEYYVIDPGPEQPGVDGWRRVADRLEPIGEIDGWVSPRLGVRFVFDAGNPRLIGPDGEMFLAYADLARERDEARQRAEAERQRAEAERQRAERMAARLRDLGADPGNEA